MEAWVVFLTKTSLSSSNEEMWVPQMDIALLQNPHTQLMESGLGGIKTYFQVS
jgi:hypothetical protein